MAKMWLGMLPRRILVSRLSWVIFFLVPLICFSCRKDDEDDDPPKITITEPTSNNKYDGASSIRVRATVSDESNLSKVLVYLADGQLNPVDETIEYSPNTPSFTIDQNYTVRDVRLETGNYFLVIEASDGVNGGREMVQIGLQEVERQLNGIVYLTPGDFGTKVIRSLDQQLEQPRHYHGFRADLPLTAMSSYHQRFYFNEGHSMQAFDFNSNRVIWTAVLKGFVSAVTLSDEVLFAHTDKAELSSIAHTGEILFQEKRGENRINHDIILVHEGGIYTVTRTSNPDVNNLVTFVGINEQDRIVRTDFSISHMFGIDQRYLLLFGKRMHTERLVVRYDLETETFEEVDLFFSLEDLEVIRLDADTYLYANSLGIFRYQLASKEHVQLLSGIAINLIAYDSLSNKLYVVTSDEIIRTYDYQPNQLILLQQYQAEGHVENLHIWYSK